MLHQMTLEYHMLICKINILDTPKLLSNIRLNMVFKSIYIHVLHKHMTHCKIKMEWNNLNLYVKCSEL